MDLTAQCPQCGKSLKVPERLIGRAVRCPNCKTQFATEAGEDPGFEVVEEQADIKPRSRKPELLLPPPIKPRPKDRDIDDDDDESEFDDSGTDMATRRRRRRARARNRVMAPALAMMILGGLWLVLNLAGLAITWLGESRAAKMGPRQQSARTQDDDMGRAAGYLIATCFLTIWPVIPILGGYKMKQMENYSSVLIAAMASFLPCGVGCVGGIPIGIWTLIVLNDPDVRKSFSS